MSRFRCGVPNCNSGRVVDAGPPITVVECDEHNARTSYDTEERVLPEQKIIRVQDSWHRHGVTRTPK